jgi:autotransporter adhesin
MTADQGGRGDFRVALGAGSHTDGTGSTALGANSRATNGAVAIGFGSVATDPGTVSFGTDRAPRVLVNVAAGEISASSTQAVNGSQLFSVGLDVAKNSGDINNLYSLYNSYSSGNTGNSGNANNSAAPATDVVAYDSPAHDQLALGNAGTPVTVSNVQAGELNAGSTEAVNGSQLYATNQNVAQMNSRVTSISDGLNAVQGQLNGLSKRIDDVDARATAGVAMATAAAQILPNPHAKGNFNVGVGVGNYYGSTAVAFGTTALIGDRGLLKGTVAVSNRGGAAIGAGANFSF